MILPTCRRGQLLLECIDSILAGDYGDFEIVVVDQDPARSLEGELAKRYPGDERVRYVYQEEMAADRARNTGIREARGEIMVVADDDVEVAAGWLAAYVEAFDSAVPRPGLVAGRLRAKTGTLYNVCALSGYVVSVGGEKFAFSMLINDYPGSHGDVIRGLDALGTAVAASGSKQARAWRWPS